MSGLAKYLLSLGKKVGGSDVARNTYTDELIKMGAEISFERTSDGIENFELIIYTDAVKDTDLRLSAAKELGKEIISRGKFLYEISLDFDAVIAVAGCHGKTTCTAMLAHIFAAADKKFSAHMGGNDLTFSNFYFCGTDYFITEACEYKKNFLLLKPTIAVVLNSEADHMECYDGIEDLKNSYIEFAESAPVALTLYRDLPINTGFSFGFDRFSDYYAENIKISDEALSFTACERGKALGNIDLNVHGKHNVLNALAAIAAARCAGIEFGLIQKGLQSFCGVERRFEKIGSFNGAVCIADYAHHPNELRAVIRTASKICKGKLFVVFQPHTYSRTKNLFKDFVKVLSPLNDLLIYDTFAAREYYDDEGSALTLSQAIKKSHYGDDINDLIDFLKRARENDVFLFLGAGDIYFLAKKAIVFLND